MTMHKTLRPKTKNIKFKIQTYRNSLQSLIQETEPFKIS